jgi:hypothetical protein
MITEIIIVILFCFFAWYILSSNSGGTSLVDLKDGTKEVISKTKDLTEFSYTCWIRIDDFTYNEGIPKIIFVKGSPDLEHACPALLLDSNTNTLLVKLDTFGSQETISVTSIPSKKWMHIALCLKEHEIKVYINGIEYTTHSLVHLPKTNTGQLITSPNGGFSGKIAKLQFYPRTLKYDEVTSQSKDLPSVSEKDQVFPPYFDLNWFKP